MAVHENAQDLVAFLRSLRAVRQFSPETLPQDVIDAVLNVARWSGSASNQQPWELVVIRDRQTLQALAGVDGYAGHLASAAMGIVLAMAGSPDRVEHETYDEGRLSERIMLAASAYGLGSSIGWFVGDGRAKAKSILGIPQAKLVRTALSFGYPDEEALRNHPKPAQARKPLGEMVHWGHY